MKPELLRQIFARDSAASEAQNAQLVSTATQEAHAIDTLLTKAGVDPAGLVDQPRLIGEASDHYWVQYQNESGAWVDLDASFATAEPGQARAHATRTFQPGVLPEEL